MIRIAAFCVFRNVFDIVSQLHLSANRGPSLKHKGYKSPSVSNPI